MFRLGAILAVGCLAVGPVRAVELSLPIDCRPGSDCWFVNFVDLDPGPGVRDFGCGAHGYDGHKGTDIAIRDRAAIAAGVDVVAAAGGIVAGLRDSMADGRYLEAGRAAVEGKECGNGVLLRHGDGWETQYCHLREGSVAVAVGDRVERGAVLGRIGLSGLTEFPHVHLSVRKDGAVIDPFAGLDADADACAVGPNPLWRAEAIRDFTYPPSVIYRAGFATGPVDFPSVDAGDHSATTLPGDVPALVVFAAAYWVHKGDRLRLVLMDPDGAIIVDKTADLVKTQARRYGFAGRKRRGAAWPAGQYRGRADLIRDGAVLSRVDTILTITP